MIGDGSCFADEYRASTFRLAACRKDHTNRILEFIVSEPADCSVPSSVSERIDRLDELGENRLSSVIKSDSPTVSFCTSVLA